MVPDGSNEFGPDRYGRSFADVYDDWYDDVSDADATAKFIDRFGEQQRVLELGVGTGRLSMPISSHGHWVIGVDASTDMLERFRSTPTSDAVGATMEILPFRPGSFDTVLVATNTLFNLHTEMGQRQCFVECRRVLRLGGRMVIEAIFPGDPDPQLDRLVTTRSIDVDTAVLTATIRDSDRQEIVGQHIEISETGIRMRPWKIRYATPAQLDEMADSSGLRLGQRFSGWHGDPVDDGATSAVSVYTAI
ncbi:MAG: ubiquinone/menaquinone biosynthesis C-methylase UbiE [Verrucomicrobiales bacterium]|jgi:ubiquinone/menaquinone biosynthesis C-methylase UbiE